MPDDLTLAPLILGLESDRQAHMVSKTAWREAPG